MKSLNKNETLATILFYLKQYYEETKPDDSGILVDALQKLKSGEAIDAQILQDWLDSIHEICAKYNHSDKINTITEEEAFFIMEKFLAKFFYRTKSDDIGSMLSELLNCGYGSTADPGAWQLWQENLNKVKKNNTR